MRMTLDLQGALRQEEMDTHREFMRQAGYVSVSDEALERLEASDDNDDDLPLIQPA